MRAPSVFLSLRAMACTRDRCRSTSSFFSDAAAIPATRPRVAFSRQVREGTGMAKFRTLTSDDVREILGAFDALGASSYRSHAAVAAGTINTNVRVETTTGAVFLRVNEGKTRDDVAREAAIVAHAAAHGVPTPAMLRARDGETFAVWRGELASVFPWVAGRTLTRAEVTPAHAALVGGALAKLHLASEGYVDR